MKKFRPLLILITATTIIFSVLIVLDHLFTTTTGLRWLFSAAQHLLPGQLEAESVDGVFLGEMQIRNLHYRNDQIDLRINQIEMNWNAEELLQNKLFFHSLHVNGLIWQELTKKPKEKLTLPHWRLPFRVWIEDLQLKDITVLPLNLRLQMRGRVTDQWNITWQASQKKLSHQSLTVGMIYANGSVQGNYKTPRIKAIINASDLRFQKTQISTVKADCDLYLASTHDSQINLTLNNLWYEQFVFSRMNLSAKGNFKKQTLQLQISPITAVNLAEYGIKLQAVQLNANLVNRKINWFASARSGKGNLQVTGTTIISSPDFPTVLSIHSTNFVVSNTIDYKIMATSDLLLKFSDKRLDVTGKLFLPTALLKFDTENTQAISLSHDVIFVDHSATQNMLQRLAISAQIDLQLGKEVRLVFQGLQSQLQGELTIRELPDGPITAVGQIELVNGQYIYSNQTLAINPGSRFVYVGGDIANPTLNIQAVKTVTVLLQPSSLLVSANNIVLPGQPTKIIVGVNVRGTVKDPQLSLFAQPASLSQADILSYILFNEPSDQVSGIDAQVLFTAASSLNIGESSAGEFKHLMQALQKTINLDKFAIENSPYFNPSSNTLQQNTSLVLGKALSPKLYISYSMGLLQPINILQIRYILSKYWSLQSTSSSVANGVDLLYTIEKD